MGAVNINRVLLTGNLVRDPELRQVPSGASVCSLRIAVNDQEKRGDEWVDRANYFDVTVWGKQAENVAQFMSKGSPIAVDGRLRFEEWEKEGNKRSKVVITADNIQFLSGKRDDGGQRSGQATSSGGSQQAAPASSGNFGVPTASADDDIPF